MWARESEVEGANTGGAVGRIWEERERARKGLPSAATASGVAKGKGKAKAKEVGLSKGQTTLSFAKVVSTTSGGKAVKPKPKTRLTKDGYETGSDAEEEEEEVLVLDDERENEEEKPFVPSEVYKKRRIAVASDEEDE